MYSMCMYLKGIFLKTGLSFHHSLQQVKTIAIK